MRKSAAVGTAPHPLLQSAALHRSSGTALPEGAADELEAAAAADLEYLVACVRRFSHPQRVGGGGVCAAPGRGQGYGTDAGISRSTIRVLQESGACLVPHRTFVHRRLKKHQPPALRPPPHAQLPPPPSHRRLLADPVTFRPSLHAAPNRSARGRVLCQPRQPHVRRQRRDGPYRQVQLSARRRGERRRRRRTRGRRRRRGPRCRSRGGPGCHVGWIKRRSVPQTPVCRTVVVACGTCCQRRPF